MPKSATFASPRSSMRTFAGFRSECTSPAARSLYAAGNLSDNLDGSSNGHQLGVGFKPRLQIAALDQFVHNKRRVSFLAASIQDTNDGRVVDAPGLRGLFGEAAGEPAVAATR